MDFFQPRYIDKDSFKHLIKSLYKSQIAYINDKWLDDDDIHIYVDNLKCNPYKHIDEYSELKHILSCFGLIKNETIQNSMLISFTLNTYHICYILDENINELTVIDDEHETTVKLTEDGKLYKLPDMN